MAYLGAQPNKTLTKTTSQSFNGTGSATTFTLNRAVNTEEELEVFVENVQQEPGSGKSYTASGTTLTFDEAPPSGTGNVYVIYRGQAEVTTRLEHDANQALSATTGTFSGSATITGDLTVDTNTLVVDATSNDVGIGTTTPNKSSSSNALTVNTGAAANYAALELSSNDTLNWYINANNAAVYDATQGTRSRIFFTNGSERLRILSGGGLTFNGDTAAANALDDYEEGTWTPFIYGTTTAGTWTAGSNNGGRYQKVGNRVTAWLNAIGSLSGAAGSMYVGGLPYANSASITGAKNALYSVGSMQYWSGPSGLINGPLMPANATFMYFHTYGTNSTAGGNPAIFNGNHNLHCFVNYFVS